MAQTLEQIGQAIRDSIKRQQELMDNTLYTTIKVPDSATYVSGHRMVIPDGEQYYQNAIRPRNVVEEEANDVDFS